METLLKADLMRVQQRLRDLGFDPGPVDGVAGPRTSAAIISFKKAVGLRHRDKVGPVTLRMLFEKRVKGIKPGIPPLARPFIRRLGWHEKYHTNSLISWFRSYGKYLGNPKQLPWCGEGMENAALEMFPDVPVPSNPFWAQAWDDYGADAGGPVVGSIGVIRWNARAGHVGVVAHYDAKTRMVTLIGCNQGDKVSYSAFPRSKFIAFRVPPTEKDKIFQPFSGAGSLAGFGATR